MDFVYKFPKVFLEIKRNGEEFIGIDRNAKLSDLFEAYSEIVHYIDGEVVIALATNRRNHRLLRR